MMDSNIIILGGGTGGLTAAYHLLKQGYDVTIIEKEDTLGGLMRPVLFNDFSVDFGYKSIPNRIPEVHQLWKELLGDDFKSYNTRKGVLYKGYILEKEKSYKGIRRGMPIGLLIKCFADMFVSRYKLRKKAEANLEEYTHARRGRKFTKIFSQEFDERFKGWKWSWSDAPMSKQGNGFVKKFLSDANKITLKHHDQYHPSKGTGQIIVALEKEIKRMGGKIYCHSEVIKISTRKNNITDIRVRLDGKDTSLKTNVLISSIPLKVIGPLMGIDSLPTKNEMSFHRGVIMVYLFLETETTFPHSCLNVSCPNILVSRITNYSSIGKSMVPVGKGCLCLEYFKSNASELFQMDDETIFKLALDECGKSGLLKPKDCSDYLIIRGPDNDAASSWQDYIRDPSRKAIYNHISAFNNLYQINRPGIDKSTYAGLMAAKSIISGSKENYNLKTQPEIFEPWKQ